MSNPLLARSTSRRDLLKFGAASALSLGILPQAYASSKSAIELLPTTQTAPEGCFRLGKFAGRTWLITPEEKPFFSIGFNHIDPTPLRYPENGDLWHRKYGNRVQRWLEQAVRPDLLNWGFNSVGNTVETASSGPTNHKQSRHFTYAEYQWLGLPYCHSLPFADFHHWDAQTRNPDLYAPEFEEWCDYVAREFCATMRDDKKLIGYFYVDCPAWVHTHPHSRWRGPLFDYKKLESQAGQQELTDLASRYYQVTHDAIRRYDPHHLILGDRYEARGRMAEEVLQAAKPFVDVLSFQDFGSPEQIRNDLNQWADQIGMPVLLADSGGKHVLEDGSHRQNVAVYEQIMQITQENPNCIGFHLCGAYLRSRVRRKGLRFEDETPDQSAIDGITAANKKASEWLTQQTSSLY